MARIVFPALFLICLFLPGMASSSQCPSENPWLHSFYFENDLFSGTDQNYTNGVKYSLISPDLSPQASEGRLPRRLLEEVHRLPFIKGAAEYTHKAEVSIGQNMYTPSDTLRSGLVEDDRPYAGWTYFSTSYHRKSNLPGLIDFMDTLEVQIGLVGPESFAEETQRFVHEQRHLPVPNGWDNQLNNEPGLVLAFERKWLVHPTGPNAFGFNATTHLGATLGNVSIYANSGIEARLGWNLPRDFGASLIRPAGSTRLSTCFEPSIYAFAALNSRIVGRDIFLDGNTFTNSHSVTKRTFVADLAGGLTVNYRRFTVTWAQILRSEEFYSQDSSHSFGALSLSFSVPF
jgi:hypothetical protein